MDPILCVRNQDDCSYVFMLYRLVAFTNTMGKCVSRHKKHKGRGEDDAPYEPAAVLAIEDKPGEEQGNPAAGKQDDPVHPEEVNGEVLDELPSTSRDDHGDDDNPLNDNNEAASDQESDSQTELHSTQSHDNSEEKGMSSDSIGGHGYQSETKDSKMRESKKSKPSLSNRRVAIAISPKPSTSIVPESTGLHQVSIQALINY